MLAMPSTRTKADRRSVFGAAMCRFAVFALVFPAPAVAETVGPGTESLSSTAAASLFAQVCIETRPKLAKAKAELAKLGYVAHPDSGTFYDNRSDVSFKLLMGEGVCSMVIGSDADPMEMVMFLVLSAGDEGIDIDPDTMTASATLSDGAEVVAHVAEFDGYFRAYVQNP